MYRCLPIFLLVFIAACNPETPLTESFSALWKNDPKGCQGKRAVIAHTITSDKKKWIGLDDDVLIGALGKPDKSSFFERNAKAYTWFIAPGGQCSDGTRLPEGKKITFEINAIGYVHIVRIEN
jgi:hypothetical protein